MRYSALIALTKTNKTKQQKNPVWKHVSISRQQKGGHSHSITVRSDGSRRPPVVIRNSDTANIKQ